MLRSIALPTGLAWLALAACQAPLDEAALEARFQQRLAQLFPELPTPIDRAAIETLLERESTPAGSARDEELRAELRAALDAAQFARARDLLVEHLGTVELDQAAALLDQGDPRVALARLERSARNLPDNPRLRALRGEARWLVGSADQEELLVREARADLEAAALALPSARVLTCLAQAQLWLGEPSAAHLAAERAVELGSHLGPEGVAERERARAALLDLRQRQAQGASPEALEASARQCVLALDEWIGFAPLDRWAWIERTALWEEFELPGPALQATQRALDWLPGEWALHQRHWRLCLALGGETRVIEEYQHWSARHPRQALGAWFPALAHVQLGLRAVQGGSDARQAFAAAQVQAQRFQDLAPAAQDSLQDLLQQVGLGQAWSLYYAGEWAASEQAFRACAERFPGSLLRADLGLGRGVDGLELIGAAWAKRIEDPSSTASLEALERAGAVYEFLHAVAPDQADWANNAGFFLRDLAVALELSGRNACSAGQGVRAEALLARARETMERSWSAYQDAAELSPSDARVVNDAGLILTYYLQRDPDRAQGYFERASRLGESRRTQLEQALAEEGLDPQLKSARARELEELVSAIGDAQQNLGVLYLTLRGDAKSALPYLRNCLGMGPDPRPEVVGPGGYLERCQKALSNGTDPRVQEATRWAAPCTP